MNARPFDANLPVEPVPRRRPGPSSAGLDTAKRLSIMALIVFLVLLGGVFEVRAVASGCYGPSDLPVWDNGQPYTEHGDYGSFTIDLIPPNVDVLTPLDPICPPAWLPLSMFFAASDDDGALGGVVHELVKFNGCTVCDGLRYGDGDGICSDEGVLFSLQQFRSLCGWDRLPDLLQVAAEAKDCGGNVGTAAEPVPIHYVESLCGNGTLECGEECDDRNTTNGDGCDSQCRIEQVRVVGIEVTQAIQDLKNSVRLIADKTTFVRAYLEPTTSFPLDVTVRLLGYREDGAPLQPAIDPQSVRAELDPIGRRGDPRSSAIFALPSEWLTGKISLELAVDGFTTRLCAEPAEVLQLNPPLYGTAGDCKVTVTFQENYEPSLKIVQVQWLTPDGKFYPAPLLDGFKLRARLAAALPASARSIVFGSMYYAQTPPMDLAKLLAELGSQRAEYCTGDCRTIYHGMYEGPRPGRCDAKGLTPSGGNASDNDYLSAAFFDSAGTAFGSYGHSLALHEIGHNMREKHPSREGAQVCNSAPYCPTDQCGGLNLDCRDFEYFHVLDGVPIAVLGPLDYSDPNSIAYGVDVSTPDAGVPFRVAVPTANYELMSYCGQPRDENTMADGVWQWPSESTYLRLMSAISSGRYTTPPSSPGASLPKVLYLLVAGVIDLQADTVDLRPIRTVERADPPPDAVAGSYSLRTLDGSGNVLEETAFEPARVGEAVPGDDSDRGIFAFLHRYHDSFEQIQVMRNGIVIHSVARSSFAPTVHIDSPADGESLSGPHATFRWTGVDRDGDALSYSVSFSADQGASWEPLAVEWQESSLTVDLDAIPGGREVLLRVVASDGVNCSEDVSDAPFTVADHVPLANIRTPVNRGEFVGQSVLYLSGEGWDVEDGDLEPASLSWASDLDGALGVGHGLQVPAVNLAEGVHRLSLHVHDSAGQTGEGAVYVRILRSPLVEQEPVADAGDDQTTECSGGLSAAVTLDGSRSTAAPGRVLVFHWTGPFSNGSGDAFGVAPTVMLPFGTSTITLNVNDGAVDSFPDETQVRVVDTAPPAMSCPPSATVECQASGSAEVMLPPAMASDVCSITTTIMNDRTPGGADASGWYPLGATTVTFTATDGSGNAATCQTTVTVVDTTAPIVTVNAAPNYLWPPNHQMYAVHSGLTVVEACDPSPHVVLQSVLSSEPDDAPGGGDGSTVNDIQEAATGGPDFDVLLRAERQGNGPGRTYTIEYLATDGSGNTGVGTDIVTVPHDQEGIEEPISLGVSDPSTTVVSWEPVYWARHFDVIRGGLDQLRVDGSNFDLGSVACLGTNVLTTDTTAAEDTAIPEPGKAFYYLVQFSDGTKESSYGEPSAGKARVPGAGSQDCH